MKNIDALFDELGLPELKGLSDEPAPEPVDIDEVRRLAKRELDADDRRRLFILIGTYREWAEAYASALGDVRVEKRTRPLSRPRRDSPSFAIPLSAVVSALFATIIAFVGMEHGREFVDPTPPLRLHVTVFQQRSGDTHPAVKLPDGSIRISEDASNLRIQVESTDAGNAVAVTLFEGEVNVPGQVIDVPRNVISSRHLRIPVYPDDFDVIVFVTQQDALDRIRSLVNSRGGWADADTIASAVTAEVKKGGADWIHVRHHTVQVEQSSESP